MASEQEINRVVEEYADTVRRICYSYMKNYHDTEDIFQTVFLKYIKAQPDFVNQENEKAWFIRVTINCCKDYLKNFFRRNTCSFQEIDEPFREDEELSGVREAVLSLPEKYRLPVYLHYYEGYTASEIGRILGKKENTIYTRLSRGKDLLRKELGGEWLE
ncbi:MAG: sigma-70 family RNA polymerase sigma factor [Eubacteriales bacterium]|nr:sigma-70 family RNA polymerase sigma factor [Eubacteriales bacterium]